MLASEIGAMDVDPVASCEVVCSWEVEGAGASDLVVPDWLAAPSVIFLIGIGASWSKITTSTWNPGEGSRLCMNIEHNQYINFLSVSQWKVKLPCLGVFSVPYQIHQALR
jgi:hypothetical protein